MTSPPDNLRGVSVVGVRRFRQKSAPGDDPYSVFAHLFNFAQTRYVRAPALWFSPVISERVIRVNCYFRIEHASAWAILPGSCSCCLCTLPGARMNSTELANIALRVLRASIYGDNLNIADLEILRENALPDEAGLPMDDLACRMVSRLCNEVMRQARKQTNIDVRQYRKRA